MNSVKLKTINNMMRVCVCVCVCVYVCVCGTTAADKYRT